DSPQQGDFVGWLVRLETPLVQLGEDELIDLIDAPTLIAHSRDRGSLERAEGPIALVEAMPRLRGAGRADARKRGEQEQADEGCRAARRPLAEPVHGPSAFGWDEVGGYRRAV